MKISELRIGNYVSLKSREAIVAEVHHTGILAWDLEETQDTIEDVERLEGIIITEKWLLNLGFTKVVIQEEEYYYFTNSSYEFELHWTPYKTRMIPEYNGRRFVPGYHLKYIHQLQNLCFALTGEELKIKV